MKRIWKIMGALLVTAITLVTAISWFSGWSMNSHGADLSNLAQVTNGMTMAETQSVLGKPWRTRQAGEGATLWVYGQSLKWCNVIVRFSSSNQVESIEHDH